MKHLTLTATALALSASALANPESYMLDPQHTIPSFSVSHFGMSTVRGLFEGSTGKVTIDRNARTGAVDVRIPTNTVYTGYQKASSGRSRDDHLRSADFFNAAEFPDMVYKSTKFVFNGDKLEAIEGNLTLLGVTKQVRLKVDSFNCGQNPFLKKDMCGADLSGSFKRTDFGMKFMVPAVGDEVKLNIAVEAYKQ